MMFIFFDRDRYEYMTFDNRALGEAMLRSFHVDPSVSEMNSTSMRRARIRSVDFDEYAHCRKFAGWRSCNMTVLLCDGAALVACDDYVEVDRLVEARREFVSRLERFDSGHSSVAWF